MLPKPDARGWLLVTVAGWAVLCAMAALTGECSALNAPTPAPPMAPAASNAATRRVFFETVEFMEKAPCIGKAHVDANAQNYDSAGLDET